MTSPTQVLKSVGPKLVPFFKTVAIYFVLFIPVEKPSWFAMLIKCLPVISLVVFVLLHQGMGLADEYAFSRRIILGLLFSCIGDALLIWPEYFIHGMMAFSCAQLMYTNAFKFKPFNLKLGIFVYTFEAASLLFIMPNLKGAFKFFIPIYSTLLSTMVWRAVARVQLFEELWTWTKLCSCVGGLLFFISDSLIAFHEFYTPIPYSQALIMITYYAAQLGITLSVVDSVDNYHAQVLLEKKAKRNAQKTNTKTSLQANVVKKNG